MKISVSNFFLTGILPILSLLVFSCTHEIHQTNTLFEEVLQQRNFKADEIDSLYQLVLSQRPDKTEVDVLIHLFSRSLKTEHKRYDILDTAIVIADQINYTKGMAHAHDRKGLNLRFESLFKESLSEHKKALSLYKKTNDTLGRVYCLNNLGVVLRKLNHEQEAMKYYMESLELSKLLKNEKNIAIALNGVGNVFINMGQYDKAMGYFQKALALEIKRDNKRGINYDLSNIGEVFMLREQFDSAMVYYEKALEIGEERMYKSDIAIDYFNLGVLYKNMGKYDQSIVYLLKSIPKLKQYESLRYLSKTYINLGINYSLLKQYEKAGFYLSEGLKIAEEIESQENIICAYEAFTEYYKSLGNYKKALEFHEMYLALKEEVNSGKTKRNIASLEVLYERNLQDVEIEKYHAQFKLHQSQTIIQYLIIGAMLILVIVLLAIARLRKQHSNLIIDQMRNDIQDYISRIENFENQKKSEDPEDEKKVFYKNVEKFGLSEREIDVLILISKGLKNDEIAEELFLSVSTVKTHTRNIFTKLDVRNRIEAARVAKVI